MTSTVHDVLDQLRKVATSEADKGARFERLLKAYLTTDPAYVDQFSEVYLWPEWPGRGGQHDTGIDLVAVAKTTGGNVAIQAKFYASDHHVAKTDLDSFLSASGKATFSERIIVSTGADWGPNAEATLKDQQPPVRRIGLSDMENSTIDASAQSHAVPRLTPRIYRAADTERREGIPHDVGRLRLGWPRSGTGRTDYAVR